MHSIRLRGPWSYQPLARSVLLPDGSVAEETDSLPAAGKMPIPSDWGAQLGHDFHGRVRFERWFGMPSGLGPSDKVFLGFESVDGAATVLLGVVLLDAIKLGTIPCGAGPTRFEVTERLAARNLLVVEIDLPRVNAGAPPLPRGQREGLPGGLIGEVTVQIEPGI